ncbi:hypothetical protein [Corallococcus llansteffanensis]|uniref:Tail fiber protein n=1 Tax=Corallococcus llansteffanensis TaxID=2316731 RepID=A0A3A8QN16_9BACT|nr:hypothetical protein [Corallococcus llansteffanensis]RKH68270.1 hypothetical protein D7V93_01510 [Corallococcus llansteffanensis]
MSNPYYPAKPGDPILADNWNNMQVQVRTEIRSHTHSGGEDGKKITGSGIDPTSTVRVNELHAAVKLTVKDVDVFTQLNTLSNEKLAVAGGAITGELSVSKKLMVGDVDVANRLNTLSNEKLAVAGGAITGDLSVGRKLQVSGGPIVPKVGNTPGDGIMFPTDPGGGGGDSAFIRYFVTTGEDATLRIGIDNDAEDTLSLWQCGADRLVIKNGNVGIRGALTVQSDQILVNNNQLVRSTNQEIIRIVRGSVHSNGNAVQGAGFKSQRAQNTSAGTFLITFDPPFSAAPTMVATQASYMGEAGPVQNTPSTLDNAVILGVDRSTALIRLGDGFGTGYYRHFHFLAIGW